MFSAPDFFGMFQITGDLFTSCQFHGNSTLRCQDSHVKVHQTYYTSHISHAILFLPGTLQNK